MIIDCHAHVFAFPKIKLPGSTTLMSAEDQIAVMNAKGVDKVIILPLNNAETLADDHRKACEGGLGSLAPGSWRFTRH